MKLLEVRIANYKSFGAETVIDLRNHSGDPARNVFLIGGMNGAGKTTFTEAIQICLYGRRWEGWETLERTSILNRTRHAEGDREAVFTVLLEDDEGRQFRVQRILQYLDASGSGRERTAWKFEIRELSETDNGIIRNLMYSVYDENLFNEWVERILPQQVSPFVIFDGEKIQRFASEEQEEELRKGMESVLGISSIVDLVSDLDHLLKKAPQPVTSTDALVDLEKRLKEKQDEICELAAEVESKRVELRSREEHSP